MGFVLLIALMVIIAKYGDALDKAIRHLLAVLGGG